jgi:hypothetical protein
MRRSWKTTFFGLCSIFAAGAAMTPGLPAWAAHLCNLAVPFLTGIGLLFARDFDKTSVDQGLVVSSPAPRPTRVEPEA